MEAWHLTWAAEGRTRMFPEEAQQLAAVRAMIRAAGPRLWTLSLVDDHDHATVAGTEKEASILAMAIAKALRGCEGSAPLQRVFKKPIEGRGHLERTVAYHVRQPAKHGLLECHPARWPGSSFADLVGARVIPGFQTRSLERALPRLDIAAHALLAAGLPGDLGRASDGELEAAGMARLWEATLSACGLADARRDTPCEVAARAVFVGLCEELGLDRADGRELVGVTDRGWRRLAAREPDATRRSAVRRRVAIDDWLARHEAPQPLPTGPRSSHAIA